MNWIKRNWKFVISYTACLVSLALLSHHLGVLTAHAQKPEQPTYTTGDPAWMKPAAQKPDPAPVCTPGLRCDGDACWHEDCIPRISGGMACSDCRIEFPNKKALDDTLREYVESHCVAVLTEKHTVHHKLRPEAPSFDDRMEWDVDIPEQTLRLKCSEK
jgi:hypothetical protein